MMEERNREKLQQAIRQLPEHGPDEKQWDSIAAMLDFEEQLQAALPQLPEHEPAPDLWNRMEQQLDTAQAQKPARLVPMWRYLSAVAAAIVLLLGGRYLLQQRQPEPLQVAYSQEVVRDAAERPQPETTGAAEEGLAFIEQHCSQLPAICQQPEFKELQEQLTELEREQKQVQEALQLYGEDPLLVDQQIKIENLRSQITKELIHIILS